MTPQVSLKQFDELRAALKAKKARRAFNVAFNEAVAGPPRPGRKARKGPAARKRAFLRLKAACKMFVMLRAKKRNGGYCEIGLSESCGNFGFRNVATTWYHAWPQKGGNGLRYDVRSHFASCNPCNMGEYNARMVGSDRYIKRHKDLIPEDIYSELEGLHGRRQISTVEANAMAEELERRIEKGEWA